ncbi:Hypothetical predicted protein [Cloeon dipterum]|uniref:Uncharacterized protein n=1 Tax=Cloeon dipterum TaxID=197152 RepID=A0A8S1DLT1_9INSE|nr:Hypothetical predicted protein [Cloeon dipterum]
MNAAKNAAKLNFGIPSPVAIIRSGSKESINLKILTKPYSEYFKMKREDIAKYFGVAISKRDAKKAAEMLTAGKSRSAVARCLLKSFFGESLISTLSAEGTNGYQKADATTLACIETIVNTVESAEKEIDIKKVFAILSSEIRSKLKRQGGKSNSPSSSDGDQPVAPVQQKIRKSGQASGFLGKKRKSWEKACFKAGMIFTTPKRFKPEPTLDSQSSSELQKELEVKNTNSKPVFQLHVRVEDISETKEKGMCIRREPTLVKESPSAELHRNSSECEAPTISEADVPRDFLQDLYAQLAEPSLIELL